MSAAPSPTPSHAPLIANLIAQLAFGLLAMTICLPSMQEWGAVFGSDQASVQLTFSGYVVAYGGLQLTMEEEVRVAFEIAYTSPAFRSLIGTNNGIGSQGIVIDGTEEQKRHYLPKLAAGEIIGSFALTEPGSGSDAASLRTSAVRDGDHYILNGTKRYITNAPEASIYTVMARTDPARKGAGAISAFIVERGTPGLTLGKIDKKRGQRGAPTCDVIFENCRVPPIRFAAGTGDVSKITAKLVAAGRRPRGAGGTGGA
eukprot:gene40867-54097_t